MTGTPSPQPSLIKSIFLSADENRLRLGWRLLGHFFLLVALYGCLVFWLAALTPTTSNASPAILVGQVISAIVITLSVFIARRFLDRRTFTSLGLHWDRQAVKDLLMGFGIAFPVMGIIFLIEWAVGWLEIDQFSWASSPLEVILGMLGMILLFILVGWQEELLTRGYWLQNLAEGIHLPWGVLISSILFALGHLGNPHVTWNAILGLALSGVFLAYGYLRTRQLWLPIGLHIGWNFFEGSVFGFQVSGLENFPRLIVQTAHGPELFTGGAFGPEAGLVLLPSLALGVILIYQSTLHRQYDHFHTH